MTRFGVNIPLAILAASIMAFTSFTSCTQEQGGEQTTVTLLEREDWASDVKQGINDFLTVYANTYGSYVVFDFDNTCSIFDVQEQAAVYQLENMCFEMTPSELKDAISTDLENIPEAAGWISDISCAYDSLWRKWGPFTADGVTAEKLEALHNDLWWQEFSTKILAMYRKVMSWLSTDDAYCWGLYWTGGMTPEQVYEFSTESHKQYSKEVSARQIWTSPSGIESKVGQTSCEFTVGIQVSENIKELWKALYKDGIEVWVCSASGIETIKAAIDVFGLHNYVTGVTAMTIAKDDEGKYIPEYDYGGKAAVLNGPQWAESTLRTGSKTAGAGKVTAILNAIAPNYAGRHPLAGFMDSTGDFNFCTEFSSLKLVVCFNRADRKTTDGGGLIAEVAIYEKEDLHYDFNYAVSNGDTFYLLQGRDENGLRSFRASNSTILLGSSEEKLFRDQSNYDQLEQMRTKKWSVKDAINLNASAITSDFKGYHSR